MDIHLKGLDVNQTVLLYAEKRLSLEFVYVISETANTFLQI